MSNPPPTPHLQSVLCKSSSNKAQIYSGLFQIGSLILGMKVKSSWIQWFLQLSSTLLFYFPFQSDINGKFKSLDQTECFALPLFPSPGVSPADALRFILWGFTQMFREQLNVDYSPFISGSWEIQPSVNMPEPIFCFYQSFQKTRWRRL